MNWFEVFTTVFASIGVCTVILLLGYYFSSLYNNVEQTLNRVNDICDLLEEEEQQEENTDKA